MEFPVLLTEQTAVRDGIGVTSASTRNGVRLYQEDRTHVEVDTVKGYSLFMVLDGHDSEPIALPEDGKHSHVVSSGTWMANNAATELSHAFRQMSVDPFDPKEGHKAIADAYVVADIRLFKLSHKTRLDDWARFTADSDNTPGEETAKKDQGSTQAVAGVQGGTCVITAMIRPVIEPAMPSAFQPRVVYQDKDPGFLDEQAGGLRTPFYHEVVVSGVGDCRAILIKADGTFEILGQIHHAGDDNPEETKRVVDSGGFVGIQNRVQGQLMVSRALGDFSYKSKGPTDSPVSAVPFVHSFHMQPNEQLLLMTDGLEPYLQFKKRGVFSPLVHETFAQLLTSWKSNFVATRKQLAWKLLVLPYESTVHYVIPSNVSIWGGAESDFVQSAGMNPEQVKKVQDELQKMAVLRKLAREAADDPSNGFLEVLNKIKIQETAKPLAQGASESSSSSSSSHGVVASASMDAASAVLSASKRRKLRRQRQTQRKAKQEQEDNAVVGQ